VARASSIFALSPSVSRVDNPSIARVLAEIADLLEIKGENVFKIRAYRSASETIGTWPDAVSRFDETRLRGIPGIGKDLAARIVELSGTGTCSVHQELLREFPSTILDLLHLQGVGPKTVGMLYATLGICTLDDLATAAREGRLRKIRGMGSRKEALILKAIEERQRDHGRHLLVDTAAVAAELIAYLGETAPEIEFVPVGSLRRGCETCGDIDVLAIGGRASLMEGFVEFPKTDRVLGRGDTKSSIRLRGGYQADLRLVPPESRGAAMQYFTGSKAHNILLRDRAIQQGYKLNEYGLFRLGDNVRVAGASEEGIYETLGLGYVEPELREHRGELDAALEGRLPRLVTEADLLGDLHMHTTVTDGRDTLETMADAAKRAGRQYIAITDHSRALAMANGLDESGTLEHAQHIRALNARYPDFTLMAGIECDILANGTLDLADDCLAQLDLVVASVHSHFSQGESEMTDRLLRALDNPWVDILGHPTGRLLLRRTGFRFDVERVFGAAADRGVALEINSLADRLDLGDTMAQLALQLGARLVISTDAHSAGALGNLRWGVEVARRAWATSDAVLNTRPMRELRPLLRRHRKR
jgi:DNA polymerase (family 10)